MSESTLAATLTIGTRTGTMAITIITVVRIDIVIIGTDGGITIRTRWRDSPVSGVNALGTSGAGCTG
jgi:hypothetical protein